MAYNLPFGIAFEQVTVSSTALTLADCGFSTDAIDAAQGVILTVTGNPVRFTTVHGITPTSNNGHYVGVGSTAEILGNDINTLKIIRATGSDASVAMTLTGFTEQ